MTMKILAAASNRTQTQIQCRIKPLMAEMTIWSSAWKRRTGAHIISNESILQKNPTTVTMYGVQGPECNTTKAKNVTFLDTLLIHFIVHHVLGLVDAWSDESERFRKKYVYPPPPISPDSLIRATEERNKSARRERERAQYNARGKAQRTGLGCKTLRKGLM